mmetsp:Transcript_4804/g.19244  ORF Transcript_4804/g.19244 Transcript_4804/m.19244 type:complete len:199 (-) Transcript_4804:67-663(-)
MALSNGHTPHVGDSKEEQEQEEQEEEEQAFASMGYEAIPMDGDAAAEDLQYAALEDDTADAKPSQAPPDLADAMMGALMAEYQAVLALETKETEENAEPQVNKAEAKASADGGERTTGGQPEEKDGEAEDADEDSDAKGEASEGVCAPFATFPLSAAKDTQIKAAARSLELKYRPPWADRVSDDKLAAAVRRRGRERR